MRIGWKHLAALPVAGIAVAFLVAWSGLISIKASTGHWKVTDIFLHWVMRSSVRTSAIGTTVPAFTEGMLPMAAGHFETGCAICHGSPAMPRPDSVGRMLPPPPDLKDKIATWSDAELFQIVQHGVRYTGMPAWPVAGREDEAWAMVAFLRRYRELDAEQYRTLAGFSATRSQAMDRIIETCNGCHSPARLGPESLIPRLDGQSAAYLEEALLAYADGTRHSGVMAVAIDTRTEAELQALARHFSEEATDSRPLSESSLFERGQALATEGDPDRGIPACLSCHDKAQANPSYPHLSGQPAAYLANQLRLFVGKTRGGGPFKELMLRAAENLEPADIAALADYFAARDATERSAAE
ncbi:c-type cytochrome [Shinella sp.]|uniref:c-type cytochrome n=1 Tax=Shinella sp. TaxID=1870904 RepID=UPI003F7016B8